MYSKTMSRSCRGVGLLFVALLWGLVACSGDGASASNEGGAGSGNSPGKGGASGKGGSSDGVGGSPAGASGAGLLGGAGGVAQGGGGGAICAEAKVTFERGRALVALLIDQSLSMDNDFGAGTRWTVMRDALLDPQKGFCKTLEGEMEFGLTLYTGTAQSCPMLTQVPPALNNYAAIKASFDAAKPIDNTPTGPSLAALTAQLKSIGGELPKHIVLATDGAPDTCEVPNPSTDSEKAAARKASIDAVQAAFSAGIPTHVIGVSKDIASNHLQELANAGSGQPSNAKAPFAVALDAQTLSDALSSAINGARSCKFSLQGKVKPGQEASGSVALDGAQLSYGSDWKVASESSVELLGAACKKLQQGEPTVSISFPCDSYTPADIQ